jgi:hypothetical protein
MVLRCKLKRDGATAQGVKCTVRKWLTVLFLVERQIYCDFTTAIYRLEFHVFFSELYFAEPTFCCVKVKKRIKNA